MWHYKVSFCLICALGISASERRPQVITRSNPAVPWVPRTAVHLEGSQCHCHPVLCLTSLQQHTGYSSQSSLITHCHSHSIFHTPPAAPASPLSHLPCVRSLSHMHLPVLLQLIQFCPTDCWTVLSPGALCPQLILRLTSTRNPNPVSNTYFSERPSLANLHITHHPLSPAVVPVCIYSWVSLLSVTCVPTK